MKQSTLCSCTVGLLIALLLLTAPVFALEKLGTTSMQVLKVPVGVRGVGMGNAMCGIVDNAEAVWWNPGALTEVTNTQFSFAQINMPANVQLNSLVIAHRYGDYQTFALEAINLVTDEMLVRTYERPQGTGEKFGASDLAIGASYARKLTDRFSLGGNVRYLRSSLEDQSFNGVAVDLGTYYKTGLRSLRLGMAIQNLGPQVKYSGSYADYLDVVQNNGELLMKNFEAANLPTMFRLGVGFDFFEMCRISRPEDHAMLVAIEMNHPNDSRERLNIGGEYGWKQRLFLRAGGKFGYDEESFAVGFGLRVPLVSKTSFTFDAAYSHWGRISSSVDNFMSQPFRGSVGLAW